MSKYEKYLQDVNSYIKEGLNIKESCNKVVDDNKNLNLSKRSLYDYYLKQKSSDPNKFNMDLEANNFIPTDNWSHGWLKTDKASIFIKNDILSIFSW